MFRIIWIDNPSAYTSVYLTLAEQYHYDGYANVPFPLKMEFAEVIALNNFADHFLILYETLDLQFLWMCPSTPTK